MVLQDIEAEVRASRRRLERSAGEARTLALRAREVATERDELREKVDLYEQVAALLNRIGEERQSQAQRQIEALVTQGLVTIFGNGLSFHLVETITAKRAQVDFIVRSTFKDGRTVDTPVLEARGGGLAAVVGFLLRLVVVLLDRTRSSRVLFLDESFSHVSDEYLDRVAEFLREVVDKADIQLVLVTHQSVLAERADKVYKFALDEAGQTQVTSL